MPYQVSRNGQTYGPYTLEDLQRYVASGNIASTDLAKSEDMPDWIPVSQILNIQAPSTIAAQSYMPPANYPTSAIPYPDPPNVPWLLDLALWFLTCSIFNKVYILVQAAWLQKIHPTSKALMLYIIATVMAVINVFASFSMVAVIMSHPGVIPPRNPLSSFIGLAYIGIVIGARFAMRSALEEHYNIQEPIGLRLDPVMTFFFGGIYFQYHFNRINEMKRAMRYRGSAL
jgi:GYF domain 2